MASAGVQVTMSNRDVVAALGALEALVKDHGFPDAGTVSRLGKTMRRLREAREEVGIAQEALLNAHAKRDPETQEVIRGTEPGTVVLEDARAFIKASNAQMAETRELELFPIRAGALGNGDKGRCSKCKQLSGFPGPEAYATLVDLGIVLERDDRGSDAS